ncbi:AAA family ATPase [Pseudomonas syringae]|uniref:AAA family ATPase n=1 Tax=Pseudomonas syringae TaxID=317 RepID=UPI001F2202F7|nr:AAA family ATPase [Pseudomonas syringae]MCF5353338.1 AAA family ATPase [Pseudomonas syringae]
MITLSKVTLKNFKIYGGEPFTVNFEDNRLVLLDGPNGYGKTTVFDAIELAITGNLRRLIVLEGRQNPADIVVAHNGQSDVEITIEFLDEDGERRTFLRKLKRDIANSARRIGNFSALWEIHEIVNSQAKPVDNKEFDKLFNSKNFARDFLLFHYIEQEDTSRFLKSNNEAQRAEKLANLFGDTYDSEQILQKLTDVRRKIFTARRDLNAKIENIRSLHNLEAINDLSTGETEQHAYALPWLTGEKSPFWDRPTIAQLNEDRMTKAIAELQKIYALFTHGDFFLRSRWYQRAAQERELIEQYVGYAGTYQNYQQIEIDHGTYQYIKRSRDILNSGDFKVIQQNLETAKLFQILNIDFPDAFISEVTSLIGLTDKFRGLTSIYTELMKHHTAMHASMQAHPTETTCGLCGHDYVTHDTLDKAITDHGHLLRSQLGDQDRELVTAREKFENNQLKPLLKACEEFLQLRVPPSQEELSRIAKAAANKDRVERLRGWLESEGISDLDLIAPAFPVTGGHTYISEKADLLSERIRRRIGASPDGYTESFSTDIYERVYLDYFQRESEKLRSYDIAQLDRKERFIKSQYFSSLTEVAAQLLKLGEQKELLELALTDTGELIAVVSNQIGQYRKKLITDIEIPFFIYSGKILQSHQAGEGQGVFIKDPQGNDVLKNVRLVSDWTTDHDIINTMSSGQISAVVIALTLALNRVYARRFSTILIDDPVQTMDDINMSSLVELLRNDFSDKQIIMSTHEDKVARYFTYKYIKHSGKVKIINLMQRKEYEPTNSYVYRALVKPPTSNQSPQPRRD